MKIHFVCTGNIYRSRMAEAYCNSRRIPGLQVSSSGIGAGLNGNAAISPDAADILDRYGLRPYAAAHWQRTTAELVQATDVLVCMESEHRRFCDAWIEPQRQRVEVWEVEDLGPMDPMEIPKKVEWTFALIRQQTDSLLTTLGLSHTEETPEDSNPSGFAPSRRGISRSEHAS